MEIFESVDGDTRGPCGELEQTGFPFGRPAADAFPEPLDDFVVHFVPSVVGEFAPIVAREKRSKTHKLDIKIKTEKE